MNLSAGSQKEVEAIHRKGVPSVNRGAYSGRKTYFLVQLLQ
jgi:hypothetical protein